MCYFSFHLSVAVIYVCVYVCVIFLFTCVAVIYIFRWTCPGLSFSVVHVQARHFHRGLYPRGSEVGPTLSTFSSVVGLTIPHLCIHVSVMFFSALLHVGMFA